VLLDSREDAGDALQVTMLRTYRRWEQVKETPQAYARAVLVNACRERWRHRGRHPEVSQNLDEGLQDWVQHDRVVRNGDGFTDRCSRPRREPLAGAYGVEGGTGGRRRPLYTAAGCLDRRR
jgi:DNA-directed RNA polymerase specialized sigma24 family protein